MPVTIRPMCERDRPALLECMSELQEHERTLDARLLPAAGAVPRLLDEMLEDCEVFAGTVLVAELGASLAGYIGVLTRVPREDSDEIDYTYAQITDLVVRATHRGQGIGSALLAGAEQLARDAGARWFRINVLAGNRSAHELYRARGFADREVILEKTLDDAAAQ